MDELILGWLDSLRTHFTQPGQGSCDIGQKMQYLSVDIISRLCFGKEIGCVKNDRDMHHILEKDGEVLAGLVPKDRKSVV